MAEVEDRMWYYRALHSHLRDFLRRGLDVTVALRVLDAGCGTGGLIRRLETWEQDWSLSGVDYSSLACGYARARVAAEIKEASVTALPYDAEHFQGIISADVLCQIERPLASMPVTMRRTGGI